MATGPAAHRRGIVPRACCTTSSGSTRSTSRPSGSAGATTDDAEGEALAAPADAVAAITREAVIERMAQLTGVIDQVPSAVSAVKVDGKRAYQRVRDGEAVELAARTVTVSAFDLLDVRRGDGWLDLDVRVACSSGTYVRALARDLGQALGVGGHLTALRRTRIGRFDVAEAGALDGLDVAASPGARRGRTPRAAGRRRRPRAVRDLRHGKRIDPPADAVEAGGTLRSPRSARATCSSPSSSVAAAAEGRHRFPAEEDA